MIISHRVDFSLTFDKEDSISLHSNSNIEPTQTEQNSAVELIIDERLGCDTKSEVGCDSTGCCDVAAQQISRLNQFITLAWSRTSANGCRNDSTLNWISTDRYSSAVPLTVPGGLDESVVVDSSNEQHLICHKLCACEKSCTTWCAYTNVCPTAQLRAIMKKHTIDSNVRTEVTKLCAYWLSPLKEILSEMKEMLASYEYYNVERNPSVTRAEKWPN